ncbi:helix-turn-helix domain-containing protein [Spirosoma sp. HMF4905]|uniref:Helix-turn-helix domain-containing protein n=1 Tax=Spirosoma arboris TaxID=2682092 RepID=A0A7K1S4H9_9BACT|nr:helix-turn-helix transcriptional regulator [Spirosoma arboris]MVM28732.1 helix-turn-helix domain-containing protein [Spirosoma arboris]
MRYQVYTPCDRLKPYVRHLAISEASDEQAYTVLPDTSLVMGFQYQGKIATVNGPTTLPLATAGITGIQDGFRIFKNEPATGSVLVVFTETGAASFFNEPIHELFGESVGLDNFLNWAILNTLEDQLAGAKTDQVRIELVEQFLLSRLQKPKSDALVVAAIQHIYQSKGTIRMAALADTLCISQSPLEKRFRQLVGTSPKKFSAIVRMKQAIGLFSKTGSLTEVSIESGYFDQAHFINGFKTFTGVTPTEFLKNLPAR